MLIKPPTKNYWVLSANSPKIIAEQVSAQHCVGKGVFYIQKHSKKIF